MATVDPGDDTKHRFVLYHYRYDESRRERRNVEVAAFDDEAEFLAEFHRLETELASLKRQGLAESMERVGGMVKEAGHGERQRERAAARASSTRSARVRRRSR